MRPYDFAFGALLLAASPYYLARGLASRRDLGTLRRRLGAYGAGTPTQPLWLHGVSVGETMAAGVLLDAWREVRPAERFLLTATTPAGLALARRRIGPGIDAEVFPLDLSIAVRRFLARWEPRLLVLLEKELWPNVLWHAAARGMPVAVANGHLSDRSLRRYAIAGAAGRRLLAGVSLFAVQSQDDADRLRSLGVSAGRVTVTGNLKYDAAAASPEPALAARLAGLAAGRPILVAGSTLAGEESAVLDALAAVAARGGPRPFLLLAPRHAHRFDEVAALLARRGTAVARRSAPAAGADAPADVLLLDTVGELVGLYATAALAFVGGSLVSAGGHNVLEPARAGVPIVVGPHTHNFRDIVARLRAAAAIVEVSDTAALADAIERLLADPGAAGRLGARGRSLAEEHRGAARRTVAALQVLLADGRGRAA